jgi:hypothetical protein
MGLYINHPDMDRDFISKVKFLTDDLNGELLFKITRNYSDNDKIWSHIKDKGNHAVIVIDNGAFAAAGLAYNFTEFENMMRVDNDPRLKVLISVPAHPIIDKLLEEV